MLLNGPSFKDSIHILTANGGWRKSYTYYIIYFKCMISLRASCWRVNDEHRTECGAGIGRACLEPWGPNMAKADLTSKSLEGTVLKLTAEIFDEKCTVYSVYLFNTFWHSERVAEGPCASLSFDVMVQVARCGWSSGPPFNPVLLVNACKLSPQAGHALKQHPRIYDLSPRHGLCEKWILKAQSVE